MEIIVVLIVFGLLGFWIYNNKKEATAKESALKANIAPYKVEPVAPPVVASAQDRVEVSAPVVEVAPKKAPAKKVVAKPKAPAKPRKTLAK
jgi:hypothetical protein